ncbi:MAG TPA: hypothetical protein DET40_00135 [Lentisphaeria bacterium]|nr:MAG: hypothetical protein A2X45_00775 [Lentisphaerae bacterium GWF2_50_93]HCE41940.1 hypothetical protein [Lentisphaeria bacterium]
MIFEIIITDNFAREARRLVKKYPSLKRELADLQTLFTQNPGTGTPLGHSCFKIRLAIKSKGKGKSGGARVITLVIEKSSRIYLLSVYDKSEMDSISDADIKSLIQQTSHL